MKKIIYVLVGLAGLFCVFGQASAKISLVALYNENRQMWAEQNLLYGQSKLEDENLLDLLFLKRQQKLCKSIRKYAQQQQIDLCVGPQDFDWLYTDLCTSSTDICDAPLKYMNNVDKLDLVYVNFAWISSAFKKHTTEITDINKKMKWPNGSFASAITSICYPVSNDRQWVFKTWSNYLPTAWLVSNVAGDEYENSGSWYNKNSMEIHEFYLNLSENSVVCKNGAAKYGRDASVSDCITAQNLNTPGCRALASHNSAYNGNFSVKDALTDCMNTVKDPLLCDTFVRFMAENSLMNISPEADQQIKNIVGSDFKLYSADKRFYIDFDWHLFYLKESSVVKNLYEASTNKVIGTCSNSWMGCQISDDRYKLFLIQPKGTIFADYDINPYSDTEKEQPGIQLVYIDYGELKQDALNFLKSFQQNGLAQVTQCINDNSLAVNQYKKGFLTHNSEYSKNTTIRWKQSFCEESFAGAKGDYVMCMHDAMSDRATELLNQVESVSESDEDAFKENLTGIPYGVGFNASGLISVLYQVLLQCRGDE